MKKKQSTFDVFQYTSGSRIGICEIVDAGTMPKSNQRILILDASKEEAEKTVHQRTPRIAEVALVVINLFASDPINAFDVRHELLNLNCLFTMADRIGGYDPELPLLTPRIDDQQNEKIAGILRYVYARSRKYGTKGYLKSSDLPFIQNKILEP